MVLLDASLSTDGWVDDVRVLDLEIDAAVTLGEALASADAQLLEPAARVELEQHLRSMLAEDPSLRELVGDLSRT